MQLVALFCSLFIIIVAVYGCARPAPRPPPATIDGFNGGNFLIDPKFILIEDNGWMCINTQQSGNPPNQCITRFRVSLYLELAFFQMSADEEDTCGCAIAFGGGSSLNRKRVPAPYTGAFVDQINFVTLIDNPGPGDEQVTSLITNFNNFAPNFDMQSVLGPLLSGDADVLRDGTVAGFTALVSGFDSQEWTDRVLRNNEAIYVEFVLIATYDTSQQTTGVLPGNLPGIVSRTGASTNCAALTVAENQCGVGEVIEGEEDIRTTLPFPNFVYRVATGSSNDQGQQVGSHPVDFAPGVYAVGECMNNTMCDFCPVGKEDCYPGVCDFSLAGVNEPGICRMCSQNSDCERFNLPDLSPDLGGPFTSECNTVNFVCTRLYFAQNSDSDNEDAASALSSLF